MLNTPDPHCVHNDARKASLWSWHAQCVAHADAAKARGDRKEWHAWSQAAAEVLEELA